MDSTGSLEKMKETILRDYPRMSRKDTFQFACHPGLSCFNHCCADVTIALTPYDVLRMKTVLRMSSSEFLAKYTFVPFNKEQKIPVVILKMREDERKTCPFVSEKGCTIYENRPWACRMYPVGLASPSKGNAEGDEFFFIMKERPCDGLDEKKRWTIESWIEDQGVNKYNEMGELFKEISLHHKLLAGMELNPGQVDMFYTACYDLDKFREFVFKSSFLSKFEVEPETLSVIRSDDIELMKFAFRWLRFSLFREPTIHMNKSITEAGMKAGKSKSS